MSDSSSSSSSAVASSSDEEDSLHNSADVSSDGSSSHDSNNDSAEDGSSDGQQSSSSGNGEGSDSENDSSDRQQSSSSGTGEGSESENDSSDGHQSSSSGNGEGSDSENDSSEAPASASSSTNSSSSATVSSGKEEESQSNDTDNSNSDAVQDEVESSSTSEVEEEEVASDSSDSAASSSKSSVEDETEADEETAESEEEATESEVDEDVEDEVVASDDEDEVSNHDGSDEHSGEESVEQSAEESDEQSAEDSDEQSLVDSDEQSGEDSDEQSDDHDSDEQSGEDSDEKTATSGSEALMTGIVSSPLQRKQSIGPSTSPRPLVHSPVEDDEASVNTPDAERSQSSRSSTCEEEESASSEGIESLESSKSSTSVTSESATVATEIPSGSKSKQAQGDDNGSRPSSSSESRDDAQGDEPSASCSDNTSESASIPMSDGHSDSAGKIEAAETSSSGSIPVQTTDTSLSAGASKERTVSPETTKESPSSPPSPTKVSIPVHLLTNGEENRESMSRQSGNTRKSGSSSTQRKSDSKSEITPLDDDFFSESGSRHGRETVSQSHAPLYEQFVVSPTKSVASNVMNDKEEQHLPMVSPLVRHMNKDEEKIGEELSRRQGMMDKMDLRSLGDMSELTIDTTIKRISGMEARSTNSANVSSLGAIDEVLEIADDTGRTDVPDCAQLEDVAPSPAKQRSILPVATSQNEHVGVAGQRTFEKERPQTGLGAVNNGTSTKLNFQSGGVNSGKEVSSSGVAGQRTFEKERPQTGLGAATNGTSAKLNFQSGGANSGNGVSSRKKGLFGRIKRGISNVRPSFRNKHAQSNKVSVRQSLTETPTGVSAVETFNTAKNHPAEGAQATFPPAVNSPPKERPALFQARSFDDSMRNRSSSVDSSGVESAGDRKKRFGFLRRKKKIARRYSSFDEESTTNFLAHDELPLNSMNRILSNSKLQPISFSPDDPVTEDSSQPAESTVATAKPRSESRLSRDTSISIDNLLRPPDKGTREPIPWAFETDKSIASITPSAAFDSSFVRKDELSYAMEDEGPVFDEFGFESPFSDDVYSGGQRTHLGTKKTKTKLSENKLHAEKDGPREAIDGDRHVNKTVDLLGGATDFSVIAMAPQAKARSYRSTTHVNDVSDQLNYTNDFNATTFCEDPGGSSNNEEGEFNVETDQGSVDEANNGRSASEHDSANKSFVASDELSAQEAECNDSGSHASEMSGDEAALIGDDVHSGSRASRSLSSENDSVEVNAVDENESSDDDALSDHGEGDNEDESSVNESDNGSVDHALDDDVASDSVNDDDDDDAVANEGQTSESNDSGSQESGLSGDEAGSMGDDVDPVELNSDDENTASDDDAFSDQIEENADDNEEERSVDESDNDSVADEVASEGQASGDSDSQEPEMSGNEGGSEASGSLSEEDLSVNEEGTSSDADGGSNHSEENGSTDDNVTVSDSEAEAISCSSVDEDQGEQESDGDVDDSQEDEDTERDRGTEGSDSVLDVDEKSESEEGIDTPDSDEEDAIHHASEESEGQLGSRDSGVENTMKSAAESAEESKNSAQNDAIESRSNSDTSESGQGRQTSRYGEATNDGEDEDLDFVEVSDFVSVSTGRGHDSFFVRENATGSNHNNLMTDGSSSSGDCADQPNNEVFFTGLLFPEDIPGQANCASDDKALYDAETSDNETDDNSTQHDVFASEDKGPDIWNLVSPRQEAKQINTMPVEKMEEKLSLDNPTDDVGPSADVGDFTFRDGADENRTSDNDPDEKANYSGSMDDNCVHDVAIFSGSLKVKDEESSDGMEQSIAVCEIMKAESKHERRTAQDKANQKSQLSVEESFRSNQSSRVSEGSSKSWKSAPLSIFGLGLRSQIEMDDEVRKEAELRNSNPNPIAALAAKAKKRLGEAGPNAKASVEDRSATPKQQRQEQNEDEAMAYHAEEIFEEDLSECHVNADGEDCMDCSNSLAGAPNQSIGFDENGIQASLFHDSIDIDDDYTYSKEELEIPTTSGHALPPLARSAPNDNVVNEESYGELTRSSSSSDAKHEEWLPKPRRGRRPPPMPTQMNATVLPTVLVHDSSQDSTEKADEKLLHNPHSPGDNRGIRKNLGTTQKASNSAVKLSTNSNEESDNDSAFQMESGKPQRSQSWFGSSSPRRSKSSNPRDEHITVPDGNDDEESASSKPRHRHRKRKHRPFCMCLALFLMALIGITAGIALGLFFRQHSRDVPNKGAAAGDVRPPALTTGSPSLRPSSANEPTASPIDFQDLYQRLCASLADCRTLLVEESPQGQAFHWLSGTADYPLIQDDKLLSRFALATFYFATKGPEWNQQEGWLSDQDECAWFSSSLSSCDGDDTLTALELDNNNVEGSIPTEIGLLTALTSISLRNPAESRPFIGGAIPSSLGMLTSLESLRLSGNQFSGFLPFELGKLSRLRLIDVGHNVLKGGIPFTFDGLVGLEHLDVQHNALTGAVPERFLTNALSLKEMILDDNMFSSLSAKTGTLRNLRRLSAANNDLATFPSSLLELHELVQLDLSGNGFDGTIPATIGSMQGLQELRLSSNRLGGTLPRALGTLLNLNEVLDLSSNRLTGSIPVEVSNLGQLKKLYLNSNQLGGSIPSELVRLNQITVLRLDDNALTGQVPILLCDLYDFTRALTYADCGEIGGGDACFTYCCAAETGCRCRFESTSSSSPTTTSSTNDFLRCVAS